MDLKRLDAHAGARIVQLPGTIQTADAGEILVADGLARQVGGGRVGGVGERVDGGAAHGAFEARVWVLAVEGREGDSEPVGWWGL